MITDIAVVIIAAAIVVLVALLVPVLVRLQKTAAEAERALHRVNEEITLLLPEVTRTVRTANLAAADLRQTVSAVQPLGDAAGAIGSTVYQAHESLHGGATTVVSTAKGWLAGIRAAYHVLQNGSRASGPGSGRSADL